MEENYSFFGPLVRPLKRYCNHYMQDYIWHFCRRMPAIVPVPVIIEEQIDHPLK